FMYPDPPHPTLSTLSLHDALPIFPLEAQHVLDGDLVELAVGAGPDRDDLLLHRVRRVLGLLEQLGEAGTTGQLAAARRVEVGRRSEEHTSELQSRGHLVCRLLLEK